MMGKKTRILSFLLCLAMLCGLTAPAAEAAFFQQFDRTGTRFTWTYKNWDGSILSTASQESGTHTVNT